MVTWRNAGAALTGRPALRRLIRGAGNGDATSHVTHRLHPYELFELKWNYSEQKKLNGTVPALENRRDCSVIVVIKSMNHNMNHQR